MRIRKYVRHMPYFICGLVFTGTLLGAQVSGAATYYVATNGSDSHSCPQAQSQTTPKRTINAGRSCLSGGDTLVIKPGTYTERLTGIPSGKSESAHTVIRAETPRTVTLRPSYTTLQHVMEISSSGQYITLDGLVVDGANAGTESKLLKINGDGPLSGAHHITVRNGEFKNSKETSCIQASGSSHLFYNLLIHDCRPGGGNQYGIYLSTRDTVVDRVHFYNIPHYIIQIYDGHSSAHQEANTNNTIRNSIFHGSDEAAGLTIYGPRNKIYNNVFYGNAKGGIVIRKTGNILRNNIIYGNGVGQILDYGSGTTLSHNLTTDPKFVNAAGGDFRLRPDSPAINKGVSLSEVTYDYAGVPRPQGSGYDIGAYEYNSASSPKLLAPTNLRIGSAQ
jgi:parallel beta-helix repeat protein